MLFGIICRKFIVFCINDYFDVAVRFRKMHGAASENRRGAASKACQRVRTSKVENRREILGIHGKSNESTEMLPHEHTENLRNPRNKCHIPPRAHIIALHDFFYVFLRFFLGSRFCFAFFNQKNPLLNWLDILLITNLNTNIEIIRNKSFAIIELYLIKKVQEFFFYN